MANITRHAEKTYHLGTPASLSQAWQISRNLEDVYRSIQTIVLSLQAISQTKPPYFLPNHEIRSNKTIEYYIKR